MIIPLDRFFDFYSTRHYEFQQGWGLVGQGFTLISFETFAMVFCEKFGIYGLLSLVIYTVVPISAIIMVTFLGHKMIQSGYSTKLQQYAANVNKEWGGIVKGISTIEKDLETTAKTLSDIKKAMNIPDDDTETNK